MHPMARLSERWLRSLGRVGGSLRMLRAGVGGGDGCEREDSTCVCADAGEPLVRSLAGIFRDYRDGSCDGRGDESERTGGQRDQFVQRPDIPSYPGCGLRDGGRSGTRVWRRTVPTVWAERDVREGRRVSTDRQFGIRRIVRKGVGGAAGSAA